MRLIISLALLGALIGLIFSRNGKEGEDTLRGAKKGAKLGCLIILAGLILVFFGILLFI